MKTIKSIICKYTLVPIVQLFTVSWCTLTACHKYSGIKIEWKHSGFTALLCHFLSSATATSTANFLLHFHYNTTSLPLYFDCAFTVLCQYFASTLFLLWLYLDYTLTCTLTVLSHWLYRCLLASNLSLVLLLISNLTNELRLHQFLASKTTYANRSLKTDANGAH